MASEEVDWWKELKHKDGGHRHERNGARETKREKFTSLLVPRTMLLDEGERAT